MDLPPESLYKPPVGSILSKRMSKGLTSPGPAEILYEWVLRTIGTDDSQGEIRRSIFKDKSTPPLGEAVPRARQCLEENNHPDVAAHIPEYDRGTKGPWKTFEAAAGFAHIKRELQQAGQAAGAPQVFSPHELLNRPRSLMRSALRTGAAAAAVATRPHSPHRRPPRRHCRPRIWPE